MQKGFGQHRGERRKVPVNSWRRDLSSRERNPGKQTNLPGFLLICPFLIFVRFLVSDNRTTHQANRPNLQEPSKHQLGYISFLNLRCSFVVK